MKNLDKFKETLIYLDSEEIEQKNLVTFLEVILTRLEVDTPSEMARKETERGNKISRNGILSSPNYYKIEEGKIKMVIKGVLSSKLPF